MTDELDAASLDIANAAARQTLALIDQGKIPGYARVSGLATPKSTALAHEAEVRHLIQALRACFSCSLTPDPTIEQMEEALRGLSLGEQVAQQTDPGPLGGNPELTIRRMAKGLATFILEFEAISFADWVRDDARPRDGVDPVTMRQKIDRLMEIDDDHPEADSLYDWLAENTTGHVYALAWQLNKELSK
jgi:hypothetical protein